MNRQQARPQRASTLYAREMGCLILAAIATLVVVWAGLVVLFA